jgi:Flp pilus assembly protein TadD
MKGAMNASMYIIALTISLALMLPSSALGAQAQDEATRVAKARTLIDAGSYDAALSFLQSSTQEFEGSPELLGLQATVQYQLKNFGEAKQLLQQ